MAGCYGIRHTHRLITRAGQRNTRPARRATHPCAFDASRPAPGWPAGVVRARRSRATAAGGYPCHTEVSGSRMPFSSSQEEAGMRGADAPWARQASDTGHPPATMRSTGSVRGMIPALWEGRASALLTSTAASAPHALRTCLQTYNTRRDPTDNHLPSAWQPPLLRFRPLLHPAGLVAARCPRPRHRRGPVQEAVLSFNPPLAGRNCAPDRHAHLEDHP